MPHGPTMSGRLLPPSSDPQASLIVLCSWMFPSNKTDQLVGGSFESLWLPVIKIGLENMALSSTFLKCWLLLFLVFVCTH